MRLEDSHIANAKFVKGRNAANTDWYDLLGLDSSDVLQIGGSAAEGTKTSGVNINGAISIDGTAISSSFLNVMAFGAVNNVNVISTTAFQDAIDTAATAVTAGGATEVYVPAGIYKLGPLIPRSGVWLHGAGRGSVLRFYQGGDCIAQDSTVSLSGWRLTDFAIRPWQNVAGQNDATVLNYPSMSNSEHARLVIENFVDGVILKLGGTLASTITDAFAGSNCIFNRFDSITVNGCRIGGQLRGHYSSTQRSGYPLNAYEPDQGNTANLYSNFNMWLVKEIGWDIIHSCDTNSWLGGLVNLSQNGGVAIWHGHDLTYPAGIVGVSHNKFIGLGLSSAPDKTPLTAFKGSNCTQGFQVIASHNDWPIGVDAGVVGIDMPDDDNYEINGRTFGPLTSAGSRDIETHRKGIRWEHHVSHNPAGAAFTYEMLNGNNSLAIGIASGPWAGTIRLPPNPPDGQVISVSATTASVDPLTLEVATDSGHTLFANTKPATLTATTPFRFRYIAGSTSWVRY